MNPLDPTKELTAKIRYPNLFRDIIAFIVPGLLLLMTGYFWDNQHILNVAEKIKVSQYWANFFIIIVIAYVVGQIVNALSRYFFRVASLFVSWLSKYSSWVNKFLPVNPNWISTQLSKLHQNAATDFEYLQNNPLVSDWYERHIVRQMFFESMFGITTIATLYYSHKFWFFLPIFFFIALMSNFSRDLLLIDIKSNTEKLNATSK